MELWIQHERHGEGWDHEAQQRGDHCLLYVVRVRVVNAAVAVHALPHLGGVPAGGVAAVARTTGAAGVGGAAGVAGSQVPLGDALRTPGAVDHRSAMQIFRYWHSLVLLRRLNVEPLLTEGPFVESVGQCSCRRVSGGVSTGCRAGRSLRRC